MAQLLLSTALVTAFVLWLSPEARVAVRLRLPRLLSYVGPGLLALLVATGRLHWILGLILATALLGRQLPAKLVSLAGYRHNRRAGGYPHAQTNSLAITINLRSGYIDGTILGGRLRGCRLSRLALTELLDLRNDWLAFDSEAAALLTAYLDQAHAGWRARGTGQGDEDTNRCGNGSVLSQAQAYAMLGLANGADREQIIAAHRRLMQRLHPDRGGSCYLAARINEAKAQLLGGHRSRM